MVRISLGLSDIIAILGFTSGLAGLTLSILNYLRDRSKIIMRLSWDMTISNNPSYDPKKSWGWVTVTNTGRRTVYVSHAYIPVPKEYRVGSLAGVSKWLLADTIRGAKIAEGDQPYSFPVDQSGLSGLGKVWRDVRVEIIDSTGRKWKTKRLNRKEKPSWASPAKS